jgi:phosphoglycolate phosphatase
MESTPVVLFDLDGTLIDSAPSILQSLQGALERHGLRPVVELNRHLIGPPLSDTLRLISGSEDASLLASLAQAFKASYDSKGFKQSVVYPGVGEMLSELKRAQVRMFVVTNKRIFPTRSIINWLDWTDYFEGVYSPDAYNPPLSGKHQVLGALLEAHQLDPRWCVYVGDRDEDRSAANAVGMNFVGVSWGYGEWGFPHKAYPTETAVIDYPRQLLTMNGLRPS